ncbi:sporulation protein YunB [Bacillus chungangensis]|uniref:Sporulation protein YunB n=1 Tax=Bacillus chungangensis TaxID=587633 RepID=A0ABT9WX71_9BACI|nr:sporulation protein YunB [Bacillus chungangensis]MDQ0177724.1 sporulation protein YunB [Bacillus chungangensis]
MKKRFRGHKPLRGPLPIRYVLLLTFVFFVFSTITGLWIVNAGIKPTLVSYAESQTRKIAPLVISNAINNKVTKDIDFDDIFERDSSDSSHLQITTLNTKKINKMLAETTSLVQMNLQQAERGNLEALELPIDMELEYEETEKAKGIVFSVPLGQATNNALLGNLGPRIPVRFHAIGDVVPDVKTKVKQYGINNVFVEVFIHITVQVQIIIPFTTSVTTVEQSIPIGAGYIPGEVPQYYNNGSNAPPSIQLPQPGGE